MHRFGPRVQGVRAAAADGRGDRLFRKTHQTVKKVTEDIERQFQFNTAIAAMMELVNEMYDYTAQAVPDGKLAVVRAALETISLLLAPFAPHFAEELWQALGHRTSVVHAAWPVFDPAAIMDTEVTVVVQVNGKVRSKLTLPAGASDREIEAAALADPKVMEHLGGKAPKKVIVVQGKLVNVVV
jgi:leucyl-tRNA synthetase